MKNLIRYKNRIYRKYLIDIWGELIVKGKMSRIFKFILQVFNLRIKIMYYRKFNYLKIFKKKKFINYILKKKIKKNNNNKFFKLKFSSNYFNLKNNNNILKWKNDFWKNFNYLYSFNNVFITKKKILLNKYLFLLRKNKKTKLTKTKKLLFLIKKIKSNPYWKKRRYRTYLKIIDDTRNYQYKMSQNTSWLQLERGFKLKRSSNWWRCYITVRRVSIFYGIFNIKKFRYIQKLFLSSFNLNLFFVMKLELMLNIILFRLNFFSNIYFSNNFIRNLGVFINNKKFFYPYKNLKKLDIIIIDKIYFKKFFNILFKKLFFSRKILKRNKKYYYYLKVKTSKIILNYPLYFEVNYKILHAILWRLPLKKEITGPIGFLVSSLHDWSTSTSL